MQKEKKTVKQMPKEEENKTKKTAKGYGKVAKKQLKVKCNKVLVKGTISLAKSKNQT